ncbi:MAG: DUF3306 domain-containing protein [Dichotomicrobium sp.]
MTSDEKDFLARWSRRKQAAREGIAEEAPETASVPAETTEEPCAPENESQAANEAAYDDVDFDALDYSSDYTRFMGKDVPEMVQRRALRALWRSDPILANIDGLNDYDDDFTDAATVIKNFVSSYKAGQGYRTDEEIAAERGEEEPEPASAELAEDHEEPAPAEAGEETPDDADPSAERRTANTEDPRPPTTGDGTDV